MNKPLTQEAFKDAPEWVKSASVDSDGDKLGVMKLINVF